VSDQRLRVRFAPSPTGYLHVGGARTALFNYLLARRRGGKFILRIEDTDRDRHVEEAIDKICQDLRWLGITWDEGPQVGGDYGPYRQSERGELYQAAVKKLLEIGRAYYAFETPEELEAMRAQAVAAKRTFRYPRPAALPTEADARKAREGGRPVVVRFVMPDRDMVVPDRILGDVTFRREELEDFIIAKADGGPTFHLANVVDDDSMAVTLVLRGQEHVMNTPKHLALQEALGYRHPDYGHLPLIFNMQGKKLSKRDGDVDVYAFRAAGYLPEVMVNFIALLGWSPGKDREKMTLKEMCELFNLEDVGRGNAKFDREKLLAFNTQAVADAAASEPGLQRLLTGMRDYLGCNETPLAQADDATLLALLKANKGFRTFRDVDVKSRFLFVADDAIEYDPDAVQKVLAKGEGAGYAMLIDLRPRLAAHQGWSAQAIEALLKSVTEEKGVGLGKVAQPLRVAVTGTQISPSVFDTLSLLGKDRTLRRIDRCLAARG
jgi:glutamyl-tRNA synthetase